MNDIAHMGASNPQTIYPAIRYRDPDAAIEWLCCAFGFGERAVHRDEGGEVVHAELELHGSSIMLGKGDEQGWMGGSPPDSLASTVSLYVVVDDPDGHHRRAQETGARIVRELTDQSYGSREYSARDLEGNLWSFGTYQPAG